MSDNEDNLADLQEGGDKKIATANAGKKKNKNKKKDKGKGKPAEETNATADTTVATTQEDTKEEEGGQVEPEKAVESE